MSSPPEHAAGPGPADTEREATRCPGCAAAAPRFLVQSRAQMYDRDELFNWVSCTACGLAYLDPRVPERRIARYYENYLPHRGPAAWGRWASLVATGEVDVDRARVRTVLSLGVPERVLDVGCGRPSFLKLLHDRTGARCVGTDFDASGWSAQPAQWTGLELHAGRLEELSLEGGFDRITLWHALEHLYQPAETLRHLRSLARRGAKLIIEVPDHDGLTRRMHGGCWAGYHTPRHTAAYTPATLGGLLERSGWRIVRQYQWGTMDPYVLWWLGDQERRGRSFSGSMEGRFAAFVGGKVLALPVTMLARLIPLGFQTAIAAA